MKDNYNRTTIQLTKTYKKYRSICQMTYAYFLTQNYSNVKNILFLVDFLGYQFI